MSVAAKEAPPETAEAPAKGGFKIGKLMIPAFLGLVMLVECAVAYFLIPSSDDIAAKAEATVADDAKGEHGEEGEHGEHDKGHGDGEGEQLLEVNLGNYGISSHNPVSNTTMRIIFDLFGTVKEAEESEFTELFEKNQHRLRDTVIFEIRSAELTDLTDPGLGLIKRRILEKSNTLLGKAILQEVFVSDFSFLEQ